MSALYPLETRHDIEIIDMCAGTGLVGEQVCNYLSLQPMIYLMWYIDSKYHALYVATRDLGIHAKNYIADLFSYTRGKFQAWNIITSTQNLPAVITYACFNFKLTVGIIIWMSTCTRKMKNLWHAMRVLIYHINTTYEINRPQWVKVHFIRSCMLRVLRL